MKTSLQSVITKVAIVFSLFVFLSFEGTESFAQALSGAKTIGPSGNYATIAAAIADLNAKGVTAPGVTFSLQSTYAGESFDLTANPTAGLITATGTSPTSPIAFNNAGGSATPTITAFNGATAADYIIELQYSSYITFNGINLAVSDNSVEYGFYLLGNTGAGCQYNIIENCKITLDNTNPIYAYGIFMQSQATSIAGEDIYNTFYNNTIQNVYCGIYVMGIGGFFDNRNQISKNTISNINTPGGTFIATGYSTASELPNTSSGHLINAMGIEYCNQNNLVISNNNISNSSAIIGDLIGIYCSASYHVVGSLIINIYGNTITNLTTVNGSAAAIAVPTLTSSNISASASLVTSNIYANSINNIGGGDASFQSNVSSYLSYPCGCGTLLYYTVAVLPEAVGIYCYSQACNIYSNTITNITSNAGFNGPLGSPDNGAFGIYNVSSASTMAAPTPTSFTSNIYANSISGITKTSLNTRNSGGFTSAGIFFYNFNSLAGSLAGTAHLIYGNTVSNVNSASTTTPSPNPEIYDGIYYQDAPSALASLDTIRNNTVYNIGSTASPTSSGVISANGVYFSSSAYPAAIYGNNVHDITSNLCTNNPTYAIFSGSSSGFVTPLYNSIHDNIINNITSTSSLPNLSTSTNVIGIAINGAGPAKVYNNTITSIIGYPTDPSSSANVYGISDLFGAGAGGNFQVYGNTIQTLTCNGSSTLNASQVVGIFFKAATGTQVSNRFFNNTISSLTSTVPNPNASTSATVVAMAGIYFSGVGTVASPDSIYNNTIHDISSGLTSGGTTYYIVTGIYFPGSSFYMCYGNTIYNVAENGTGNISTQIANTPAGASGIYVPAVGNMLIYKNKIYGISNNSTGTSGAYGIIIKGSANNAALFNNYIYGIRADASVAVPTVANPPFLPGVAGIALSSTGNAVPIIWCHDNSVYLDGAAASGATNHQSACLFMGGGTGGTLSPTLYMYNNILYNNYNEANGTRGVALMHMGTTYTNLGTASNYINNNDYYAPNTNGLIFWNGSTLSFTNAQLGTYKSTTGINPKDAATISADPLFTNVTTPLYTYSSYDLHITSTTAGHCYQAGLVIPVAAQWATTVNTYNVIKDDIAGNVRQGTQGYAGSATAPTIGAYEVGSSAENVYYIDGTNSPRNHYKTIAAAIQDLNIGSRLGTTLNGDGGTANGPGAANMASYGGPIIFYVGHGPGSNSSSNTPYTENFNSPTSGYFYNNGTSLGTGTSGVPIRFVKNNNSSGVADPLITMNVAGTALGSSTTAIDAIIAFCGASYITFDGIDVTDASSPASNTTEYEYGFGLFPFSATVGSHNDTIRNCNITLTNSGPINQYSAGIYSNVSYFGSPSATTPTAATHGVITTTGTPITATTGSNSFNSFYGNTISKANSGISLNGYTGATWNLEDQNNSIGLLPNGTAAGNTISNLGGTAASYYGILADYQCGAISGVQGGTLRIGYNTVNGGTGTGTYAGIQVGTTLTNSCQNANIQVYGNTINPATAATSGNCYGILINAAPVLPTTLWVGPTISVTGNTIQNLSWGTAASGSRFFGITTEQGATSPVYYNLQVSNNTIANITMTTPMGFAGICTEYVLGSSPITTVGSYKVTGNSVYNISNTSTGGLSVVNFGIAAYQTSSVGTLFNITGNTIHDVAFSSNSATNLFLLDVNGALSNTYAVRRICLNTIYNITNNGGIYSLRANGTFAATAVEQIDTNTIHDVGASSASQLVYGINQGTTTSNIKTVIGNIIYSLTSANSATRAIYLAGTGIDTVYRNKIYDISASTSSGNTSGSVYGINTTSGTNYIFNNYIGNLTAPFAINAASATATPSVYGINVGGTVNNLYYNTVYLNAGSSNSPFTTAGIYSSTGAVSFYNNLIYNTSTASGGGLTVGHLINGTNTTNATIASSTGNNMYYAGAPSATNIIFYDGTNSAQTITQYQGFVGSPIESNSFNYSPTFLNTTTGASANFLHLSATCNLAESAGAKITGPPVTINSDFDGDTRAESPGYSGTGTSPDVGADEFVGGSCGPTAYAVTGGTNCGSTTVGVANSQTGVTYTMLLNGVNQTPTQAGNTGNAISFGAQTTAGTYTVVGVDGSGNSTTMTGNAVVYANPTFTATPISVTENSGTTANDGITCSGAPVVLTANVATGASPIGYSWSGSLGTSSTASVSPTTGSPSYSVTVTDHNGCTISASKTITVNANPLAPTITESDNSGMSNNDGIICNSDAATLGVSSYSAYSWSPGSAVTQSITVTPSVTTTYSVTITDGNGCTATGNEAIMVNALPPVAVTPSNAVCLGTISTSLTASGASTYIWSPASNLSSITGATVTAQISQLTFYTVTGTDANNCSANVIVPVATVATGGTISPIFSIICSGNTKTLTVTGAAGHDYIWQISTDNSTWDTIPGATNTTYTTASGDGNTNKFYRLLARSNSCWNVASSTAEVDVSIPSIAVSTSNITDNSLTLNWSPTGTGNYTISYSGPSSATLTSVTPAKTITGLSANGTYSITVTQTGVGCAASGTITGVTTLCAMPTGVTLSSLANSQILVSWAGVVGADYRVYYRPLFSYNTYFTKDVSNVSSVLLTKQGNNNLYASTTYEVYVSRLDCPSTGAMGQGTNPTNVTTKPDVSCTTPQIDSVRSLCPVQIEVFIHDNTVNQYTVFIQRITPSILAVNSYGVSGTYFTINTPYSGDQYLIAVEAKCGGALSNLFVWPGNVTVKPLCTSPNNLVLSNPTCHGFTASWNSDQCLSNSASAYDLYLRVAGTINYNSYGVPLPANGIGPNKTINFVTSGRMYQVYVRSIYNCNGFVTYGPSSLIQTITTLSSGCRDEDVQQPEETKPAVQQYSQSNDEVFSLYPNPNNGEFKVDLSRINTERDAVRIEVINMVGQTVMTQLTTISGGQMSEFINLPNSTAAGTYIVRLTAGKNIYTAKINVSK